MKPIWKWLAGILLLIVLVLTGTSWYVSRHWKPLVEAQLKALVKEASDSLYTLTFDTLDMNLALGNVTLTRAALRADTQVYTQLEARQLAADNRYDIQVDELKITRFHILDMLRDKKLNIQSIILDRPQIQLLHTYHAYNDTLQLPKPKQSLYDRVKKLFTTIQVGEVHVANAGITYLKQDEGEQHPFKLDSVQIHVHDILLDEQSAEDTTRLYYTKDIQATVPGFAYTFANGLYRAKFDALKINTAQQQLFITNITYQPLLPKTSFYKKLGQNKTRTDLHIDTLLLEKLDFVKLIEKQQTIARAAYLIHGHAKLYGDKRYPKKPVNQIGQAPHQKLMHIKQLIHIDSVFVKNMDVVYGEMSPKYQREGEISFDKVYGTLSNVTNDTTALLNDKFMRADLWTKVMNQGNLHVQFTFDMLSKKGDYHYKGTLGAMQATAFNRVLDPLLNVGIASGNIRGIRFDVNGTDYRSRGTFQFDYNHLAIALKNDPHKKPRKKSTIKIASFIINKVIINDSNPDANEKYHVGTIDYARVAEDTFFKNIWQSLLEGIKQTTGISKEREVKWRERAETAKVRVEKAKAAKNKAKGFFNRIFSKKEKKEQAGEAPE